MLGCASSNSPNPKPGPVRTMRKRSSRQVEVDQPEERNMNLTYGCSFLARLPSDLLFRCWPGHRGASLQTSPGAPASASRRPDRSQVWTLGSNMGFGVPTVIRALWVQGSSSVDCESALQELDRQLTNNGFANWNDYESFKAFFSELQDARSVG
eukprot:1090230-Rhodomonas_salina.3